jgi:hypothetical protein
MLWKPPSKGLYGPAGALFVVATFTFSGGRFPSRARHKITRAMQMSLQVLSLFIIAVPVASIAWTVTHEEVLREFREFCQAESKTCRRIYARKFFYLFTCEFCLSHYVAAAFLIITRYKLLFTDWRGYLIAGFSLVWVANVYMGLFGRIRLDLRKERAQIATEEASLTHPT